MKCPKCGYVSFDYNQACPKCTKDITSEQQKMNLPPFRPDPPMLLGSLIGEADASQANGIEGDSSEIEFQRDTMMTFDETGGVESEDMSLEDSEAIEEGDVSFEGADLSAETEAELSDEEDLGLELELDDAEGLETPGDSTSKITEEESVTDFPLQGQEDSSEIPVDDIEFEDFKGEEDLPLEATGPGPGLETRKEAQELESDSLDFDLDPENDIDLDLENLELDDSGQQKPLREPDSSPSEDVLGGDSFPEEFTVDEDHAKDDGEASDIDELLLDEDESSATTELKDIENALDLDDLDLDLELEESEPQKST